MSDERTIKGLLLEMKLSDNQEMKFIAEETIINEFDQLKASLIDAARAIENYCNAHNLWDVNKNHMLYQGSNEQQFLDVLSKLKSQHKFLGEL